MVTKFLRGYPSWSNKRTWEVEPSFITRKKSLLPYLMAPRGTGITNETVLVDLLSKTMVGIDRSEAWNAATGFEMSKKTFSGSTFQVTVEYFHN